MSNKLIWPLKQLSICHVVKQQKILSTFFDTKTQKRRHHRHRSHHDFRSSNPSHSSVSPASAAVGWSVILGREFDDIAWGMGGVRAHGRAHGHVHVWGIFVRRADVVRLLREIRRRAVRHAASAAAATAASVTTGGTGAEYGWRRVDALGFACGRVFGRAPYGAVGRRCGDCWGDGFVTRTVRGRELSGGLCFRADRAVLRWAGFRFDVAGAGVAGCGGCGGSGGCFPLCGLLFLLFGLLSVFGASVLEPDLEDEDNEN